MKLINFTCIFFFSPIKPKCFVYIDDNNYGYTRLTANLTGLSLEYIRNTDHKVADSFTIPRKML